MRTIDFGECYSYQHWKAGSAEIPNVRVPLTETEEATTWLGPFAKDRANKLQQELLNGEPEFQPLMEIAKQDVPLTLEQLRDMSTDYDKYLDNAI